MAKTDFTLPAAAWSGTMTFPHTDYWQLGLASGAVHTLRSFQVAAGNVVCHAYQVTSTYAYSFGDGQWHLIVGSPIPGYPLAWNPYVDGFSIAVIAILTTVLAGGSYDGPNVAASTWYNTLGLNGAGNLGTVVVNFTIGLGDLDLLYSRAEVNLGETYARALWTDQLQVLCQWYKAEGEWSQAGTCGPSAASDYSGYAASQYAPIWAADITYDAGIVVTLDAPNPPEYHLDYTRVADVTSLVWDSVGMYPFKIEGASSFADAEWATYTISDGSMVGTVAAGGLWHGGIPDGEDGSFHHGEYGSIRSKVLYLVSVYDVLTKLGGVLEASATYIDNPFDVSGNAGFDLTPTSRSNDPHGVAPLTVTLTDASLTALDLPTADNKMPTNWWGLDCISNPNPTTGAVYQGAFKTYRQSPLNVLKPNDMAAAPTIWVFSGSDAIITPNETEATFTALFDDTDILVATKTLKHHYWSVWSNPDKLLKTGEQPPDGTLATDIWRWMFNFDDSHVKRKAGRTGLGWGAMVDVIGDPLVVAWGAPLSEPMEVALPETEQEDIHSYRTYAMLAITYRWYVSGSGTPAPNTNLILEIDNSAVSISDSHEANSGNRQAAFSTSREDVTSSWSRTVAHTGAIVDGYLWFPLLEPGNPPLEIVDELRLYIEGVVGCKFELRGMELVGYNFTDLTYNTGKTVMWKAYARRRRYGEEPKLPREYTGFWMWTDGLYALPIPDGELVHWPPTNPEGIEFCNSVVSDAEKVQDRLFPFQVFSRIVGEWGQEGFYGATELDEVDAAMAPFYDADSNFFGPTYALDFREGIEEFDACGDNDCAAVAGSWEPTYTVRAGEIAMAEGMCWCNGGDAIETFWLKMFKGARAVLGTTSSGGEIDRNGAGQEFGLWETDGVDQYEVDAQLADDWGFVFFQKGVQEYRNDETGDDPILDTGWLSPGTVADDSAVGTLTWGTPQYAGAEDDLYADVINGVGAGVTHYLKATNFGVSVPVGVLISGVSVRIGQPHLDYLLGSSADYTTVKLVKGGSVQGTDKASGSVTTDTDADGYDGNFGGASDMWGLALTRSDVSSSNFGVVFSFTLTTDAVLNVDHIQLKVHYRTTTNPDTGRPDFKGAVLAPGEDPADLSFTALHAQELPYWALVSTALATGGGVDIISTAERWVLIAFVEAGSINALWVDPWAEPITPVRVGTIVGASNPKWVQMADGDIGLLHKTEAGTSIAFLPASRMVGWPPSEDTSALTGGGAVFPGYFSFDAVYDGSSGILHFVGFKDNQVYYVRGLLQEASEKVFDVEQETALGAAVDAVPSIVELMDGSLLAAYTTDADELATVRSTDYGVTWG